MLPTQVYHSLNFGQPPPPQSRNLLAAMLPSQVYRSLNNGESPPPQSRALFAAVGALIVMTGVMPVDVVVKRLQVQGCPGHPVLYSGPLDAFTCIFKDEGLGAFYRGMATTYLKVVPAMASTLFFYDTFGKMLTLGGLNRYRPKFDTS